MHRHTLGVAEKWRGRNQMRCERTTIEANLASSRPFCHMLVCELRGAQSTSPRELRDQREPTDAGHQLFCHWHPMRGRSQIALPFLFIQRDKTCVGIDPFYAFCFVVFFLLLFFLDLSETSTPFLVRVFSFDTLHQTLDASDMRTMD